MPVRVSNNKTRHPLIQALRRNKLTTVDLGAALGVSNPTLYGYLKDPGLIRLRDLCIIAGLVGMNVLDLIYQLQRYRPTLRNEDKWYLEEVKSRSLLNDPE